MFHQCSSSAWWLLVSPIRCPLRSPHLLFVVFFWPCLSHSNLGKSRWWEQPGEECGIADMVVVLRMLQGCLGSLREMQELSYCGYSEQVVLDPAGNWTRKGRSLETSTLGALASLLASLPSLLLTYGAGGQVLMALGHLMA